VRLLTVGSLPPEWGGPVRGGVATFHASLLAGLLEQPEVEVVGVLPPTPLDREIPVPAFVQPEGTNRASFYEDLLERLQPDVVLMNHIANTVGVTHARLSPSAPALGVAHSWHNVTFRSGEERERAISLTEEALTGMTALVVPSRHGIAEGRRLGFCYPAIVEPIHNPLQPFYMADDIDVSVGERRDVVYLGGLIPRKEPAALVEAAALLPDVDVALAGEGELEATLRASIDRLAVGGRVRLVDLPSGEGHLSYLRDMLLRARLLCLPSRSESFGLVFIEALACGTPVVGFGPTVREIREEMGVEIGEPLERGDPEEVAGAIERVLATGWDHRELRRAAIEAFGLPRVTRRYLELLSRVAVEPAGRP
jgi:glycosyltransferase involved in cell wall biosynthesis